jgi:hypothetical protein
MPRASLFIAAVILTATAAGAQTAALPPVSQSGRGAAVQARPQGPVTQATPALRPAPPVAAPFGALYNIISGRSGATNCRRGLTPFNASACR